MHANCDCCTETGLTHFGRRRLLVGAACILAATALPSGAVQAAGPVAKTTLPPAEALKLMKEGNENFRNEAPSLAANGRERRLELARGQAPFCVLVGCSDSRVSPEILFGRGLGELFIVRNAGNTVDTAALGSIEYAVGVLGVPLVIVLGHQSCGAVAAAVEVVQNNATFPGVIGEMVQPIVPAVLEAKTLGGDRAPGRQAPHHPEPGDQGRAERRHREGRGCTIRPLRRPRGVDGGYLRPRDGQRRTELRGRIDRCR